MSFFRALFDLSFSDYVTPKIIKVLFVIQLVAVGLGAVGMFISGLITLFSRNGALAGIIVILLTPVFFLLMCIYMRVINEILIVIFQIAGYLRDMAWAITKGQKAPASTPQPQYAPQYAQPPAAPQYPQQPPAQYPGYPQQGQYPQQPPPQNPQYPQYPPKQ